MHGLHDFAKMQYFTSNGSKGFVLEIACFSLTGNSILSNLQRYYSTRQGYIKACTACGEPSWFNWRIVAPNPSDQYRIVAVSDCKRNTSFAVTMTRGTSVQNTFKPYYSRWVFKIMCTRGYDDSCLIERWVCVHVVSLTLLSNTQESLIIAYYKMN